jgi:M6 family metalloprotease-like protein
MKKNIILIFVLLFSSLSLLAGPAYPGKITYTQPDGSKINLYLHGDEWGHWATDDAGNILEQDADGYWRISSRLTRTTLGAFQEAAAQKRAAAAQVRAEYAQKASSANFGSPRIPVILVGFSDKAFTKTTAQFNSFFNTSGYSENNAIGSVWDYFNENSFGQFTPQFEVLGPVTLDNNMAYYGGNKSNGDDQRPEMALVEAAQKLDATVNFSRYDNDGDGTVEFVIFYYAGYDEAQGASSSAIWSHAWYISSGGHASNDDRKFDGVYLNRYFCTAELKGSSGSTMCSIGTTCHEFAHTLGLPDFYDADYSTNESAASMYSLSLMASGSYNVNSTTPPYFNSEELTEIGWLSAIPELSAAGNYTLPAVNYPGATQYSAYKTKTSVNNEYFVYECRRGQRWDAGIPTGMLVYHVDKSTNRVSGNITAASTWSSNSVNNYGAHPCCYVVPAAKPSQTTVYSGSAYMFGSGSYKTYQPMAWDGNTTGFSFTNITYANNVVTFTLSNGNILGISGAVMNTDGEPIEGVTITVTEGSGVSSAPAKVAKKGLDGLVQKTLMLLHPSKKKAQAIAKAASYTTTTSADGSFTIETPAGTYQVMASKSGYVSQTATVTVTSLMETQTFYLMREGEALPDDIYAWPVNEDLDEYIIGSSNTAITGQNLYPASEIGRYAGKQIKSITFYLYGEEGSTTYQGLSVIIDYDSERAATVAVPASDVTLDGYTTVDLRDQQLIIPTGKDIYAGVGYSSGGYLDNGSYYSFGAFFKTDDNDEYYDWAVGWPFGGLISAYNLTSTGTRYSQDFLFDFVLTVGDYEIPDTGYNYIADPQNGSYSAGYSFPLTLIETQGDRKPQGTIAWYMDDEPLSGTSVTLPSGTHVIEARFTTADGKNKIVELEVSVN